jgi:phenylpropionate dioxygenase-like ring-hydroxylating dioxygenase large terminal subunit
MTDLSLQLQQAASQLPVSSYFDEALFQRELETIFKRGPRYVGHQLAVPEIGDYYALPQEKEGRALVRNAKGEIELISNVCRHRQAVMLKGAAICCPKARAMPAATSSARCTAGPTAPAASCWARRISATTLPEPQQLPLREWNGLLFEDNGRDIEADLAGMKLREQLQFDGFVLDHVEMHECNYNWKTFIEVYLEDYHVGPFHPGLGNFVTCDDLKWEFASEYSVQTVGVAPASATPARTSTRSGTRCCWPTATASCPSAAPSG